MRKISVLLSVAILIMLNGCLSTQLTYKQAPIVSDTPRQYTNSIDITAPNFIENPNVVPFFVGLTKPIQQGDILNFYIDGNLSYRIEPKKNVSISRFSGRVRSFNGKMKAEVIRADGSNMNKELVVPQTLSSFIPDLSDYNTQYMEISKNHSFKALFKNHMGAKGYLSTVHIETSHGNIKINMTPYASMNPFLGIEGNFSNAYITGVSLASQDAQKAIVTPNPSQIASVSEL